MVEWMQQRLPSLRPQPIAFAHRGAKAYAPENTIEAFQLALKLGANGLETDAWITEDGEVVLDHDGVAPTFFKRKKLIADTARKHLPEHIPTLEELFEHCGSDYELSIDIKDDSALDAIVAVAKNAGFPLHRLWLCHHRIDFTLEAREKFAEVRFVDSTRLKRMKEGPEMRCALLAARGVDVLNMHISDWNGGLVTLAHKFNVHAFGWDIQFPHALNDALRMGLDAVYSDYTDRMVEAYETEIGVAPQR